MRTPHRARLLVVFLVFLVLFVGSLPRAMAAAPYHVMLLLYRGCEEACRAFQEHFRRQGTAVRFTLLDAEQDARRLPGFIAEVRRQRPDLVLAWGTTVALETVGRWDAVDPSRHITDLPVVFMAVSDPVRSGLVPSLAGSRRNVAGTLYLLPVSEQLRAARLYLPFRKVGFLINPVELNSRLSLEELRALAPRFDFTVVAETLPVDDHGQPRVDGVAGRVAALAAAGVDLLYFSPDSFLNSQRRLVTASALAHRLPVLAAAERPVADANALLGVFIPYEVIGRMTARLALRILEDRVAPGELAVERPRHFAYLINLRVAHRLQRYPPLPLLDIAEVVGAECATDKGKSCD